MSPGVRSIRLFVLSNSDMSSIIGITEATSGPPHYAQKSLLTIYRHWSAVQGIGYRVAAGIGVENTVYSRFTVFQTSGPCQKTKLDVHGCGCLFVSYFLSFRHIVGRLPDLSPKFANRSIRMQTCKYQAPDPCESMSVLIHEVRT